MDAERYIARVKARAALLAQEGLLRPRDGSAFEYGQQSGIQKGLAIALEELERSLEEADGKRVPSTKPVGSNPYTQ